MINAVIFDWGGTSVASYTKEEFPVVWIRKGKFAGELPDAQTGMPTHTITALVQLKDIL